jgi:signal transduction histidine kinase
MKKHLWFLVILLPTILHAKNHENRRLFFLGIAKLEFDSAKRNAISEEDDLMKTEMLLLTEILFYEGQISRTHFKLSEENSATTYDSELHWIRLLNKGYVSLFYDQKKGNAYKYFYASYQLAKELENPLLLRTSLLAFFRYYNFEIVQVSDSYKFHLDFFESLRKDQIDEIWHTIYKMIFYTKPTLQAVGKLNDQYFILAKLLDEYEEKLDPQSPVLAYIFYEKAIKFEIEKDFENSIKYHEKVISVAKDYPFLKTEKFSSYMKLLILESKRQNFLVAQEYLAKAKREINLADTLRSNYYLNLNSSLFFYAVLKRYDSAFFLLRKAYLQEFQLDFRRNTLEINRLNIELDTQEKENANLQLKQNRNWLISALAGVALLLVASYFAYSNQRTKNKIQAKEKEVQAMKLEKVLKDQEIFGIDAMLEGQEKERQRMAADLHDNLGSLLATLKLHFHSIKDFEETEQNKLLQKSNDLLEEAYQKVRGMAHAGNAGVNAKEGLVPAVKDFASKVSILNRLVIEVEEHGMNRRLENTLEITIFRIIQELITNIIKHAQADSVVIHLTQHEDTINLMVEDNGIGFDISQIKPSGGMGLHSIQKKIENLGGQVTIDSIAEKGTTIIIDVPLT